MSNDYFLTTNDNNLSTHIQQPKYLGKMNSYQSILRVRHLTLV